MNTIMDILGSTFIAGMLLLLILKLNLYASNSRLNSDSELRLQQNAKTLAEILNYDLRKIGYNHKKSTGSPFITTNDSIIEFWADIIPMYGNGVTERIKYFLSDSTVINGQAFRVLKRSINGTEDVSGPSLGLVRLKFSYMDSLSQILTNAQANLNRIKYVRTEMWVEPEIQYDNFMTGVRDSIFTYWEFTINPRNL